MLSMLAKLRLAIFAGLLTVIQMTILVPLMSRLSTEKPLPAVYARADVEAGKSVYLERCSGCHGKDGKGEPALAGSMAGLDITAAVHRGPAHLSHVVRNGKGAMPPFADMTDEQLRELVAYLETFGK